MFSPGGLPQCNLSAINTVPQAQADAICGSSKVGTGSATINGGLLTGVVSAYNGTPSGGSPTIGLHTDVFTASGSYAFSTTLTGVLNPSANTLAVGIPPTGTAITHFAITINQIRTGTKNRQPIYYAMARCSKKSGSTARPPPSTAVSSSVPRQCRSASRRRPRSSRSARRRGRRARRRARTPARHQRAAPTRQDRPGGDQCPLPPDSVHAQQGHGHADNRAHRSQGGLRLLTGFHPGWDHGHQEARPKPHIQLDAHLLRQQDRQDPRSVGELDRGGGLRDLPLLRAGPLLKRARRRSTSRPSASRPGEAGAQ